MTALITERITEWRGLLPRQHTKPVKAAAVIFKGAMICADSAGDLVEAGNAAAATPVLGRSMQNADNTSGADGDIECRYEAGVFGYDNSGTSAIAEADCPTVVYAEDDQTVALTSAGGTLVRAGVAVGLDEDGQVIVVMGPTLSEASGGGGLSGPAMQATDAVLSSGTVTINTGITVEPDSEVVVSLVGGITGSTNFASAGELKASRVDGAPGTGELVIQAYGADGALDTDAAGTVRVIILSPQ